MRWFRLGIDYLEMLVNIYKNCSNDVWPCTMSIENFMEMEGMLMEENEDDMGKIGLLEVDDNIVRLEVFFFLLFTGMTRKW